MHQQRTSTSKRAGFTLVELMVVILIISILSALLTMAVSQGIRKAKITRNQTEISQLAAAVDMFKTKFGVDYIPSRLYLSDTGIYPGITADSQAYLQRLWPKLPSTGYDWNGNGVNEDIWLEGDQCLVFFLGGIPWQDPVTGVWSCTGFSANPANPRAHLNGGGPVKGPFYEFDASRLAFLPHSWLGNANVKMLSYLDTYGSGSTDGKGNLIAGSKARPYLYMSSYGNRNGYNRYIQNGGPDCFPIDPESQNVQAVWPYAQGRGQYLNPTGFQIISAGADQKFGSGTVDPLSSNTGLFWSPASAASSGALDLIVLPNNVRKQTGTGADDQGNFYESTLGTPSVN